MATGAKKTAAAQPEPPEETGTAEAAKPSMATTATVDADAGKDTDRGDGTGTSAERYKPAEGERVTFEGPGAAVIVNAPEEPTEAGPAKSTCVVKDDVHTGNAVPGTNVCSYHTMHYHNDGTRRTGLASNSPTRKADKGE